MNTTKAALVFVLAWGVSLMSPLNTCLSVASPQVRELLNNAKQKNCDVTSTNYPESSAIAKAKELGGRGQRSITLQKEASQFGLSLMQWEEDEYGKLRERLFKNNELAAAFRTANQGGILIALTGQFQVHINIVDINVNAADGEIIKFLADALPVVKARKAVFEKFRKEASQFGLTLISSEMDEYKQIRNRLLTNDRLASALKTAASEDIIVGLNRKFRIMANFIEINVDASDEGIIKFILGK